MVGFDTVSVPPPVEVPGDRREGEGGEGEGGKEGGTKEEVAAAVLATETAVGDGDGKSFWTTLADCFLLKSS